MKTENYAVKFENRTVVRRLTKMVTELVRKLVSAAILTTALLVLFSFIGKLEFNGQIGVVRAERAHATLNSTRSQSTNIHSNNLRPLSVCTLVLYMAYLGCHTQYINVMYESDTRDDTTGFAWLSHLQLKENDRYSAIHLRPVVHKLNNI